jgi:hypothetical protein
MLKQFSIGGSILALLLISSLSAQANPQAAEFQSPEVPSTTPVPDSSTTRPSTNSSNVSPASDGSTTRLDTNSTNASPNSGSSKKKACRSIPIAEPSGGATRARLEAMRACK